MAQESWESFPEINPVAVQASSSNDNGEWNAFPETSMPASPPNSFFQDVSQDASSRAANTGKLLLAQTASGIPPSGVELPLVTAGYGYGSAKDIAGEAYKHFTPQAFQDANTAGVTNVEQELQPITNAVKGGTQKLADTIDNIFIGKVLGNALMGEFDSPQMQTVMNATGNIVTGASLAEGAINAGKNAVGNTADIVKGGVNTAIEKTFPPNISLSSSNLRDMAGRSYAAADAQGGILHPDTVDKWINNAQGILPQTSAGKVVLGETPATKLVNNLQQLRGQPLTLQSAQEIDSGIGALMDNEVNPATGKYTAEGNKLAQVQRSLRDTISNASPDDIVGGKDGFDAWKQGSGVWSAAQRTNDIERIMSRASMMQNPITGIQTGFRTLASNPDRMRGFTDPEVAAIKNAATTGFVSNTLRTAGSRLISTLVGASAGGGMLGAGTGYLAATPFAKLADAIQYGKANKVLNAISDRPVINNYANGVENATVPQPARLTYNPQPDYIVTPKGIAIDALNTNARGASEVSTAEQNANEAKQFEQKYGQSELGQQMVANRNKPVNSFTPKIDYTTYNPDAVRKMFTRRDWDKLDAETQAKVIQDQKNAPSYAKPSVDIKSQLATKNSIDKIKGSSSTQMQEAFKKTTGEE